MVPMIMGVMMTESRMVGLMKGENGIDKEIKNITM